MFGSAVKYVCKNFIFLFLFALLPSYFFAMATDVGSISAMVSEIMSGNFDLSFGQLFGFFSLFSFHRWAYALVAFVLTVVCMSMMLGFIEKHMRTGSRSFRGLFRGIDYNLISTFVFLSLFILLYEFWALVTAGFVSLIVIVVTNGLARCILGVAAGLGMAVLLTYIYSLFLLWLPCRQITGYSFMDSLANSWQNAGGRRGRIFLSMLIPYLIATLLLGVIVVASAYMKYFWGAFACIELVYIVMFSYFAVLMLVTYFEASGEERMDLAQKF